MKRQLKATSWIGLLYACMSISTTAFSQELLDARKLVDAHPVSSASQPITVRAGSEVAQIQLQHLQNLIEVHQRIAEVSGVNANIAIYVSQVPNAYASPSDGAVAFSTGMLALIGSDNDMLAAIMAHEHAHFSRKHSFEALLNLPNEVRSGLARQESALRETGNRRAAAILGQLSMDRVNKSFSRQQEAEADRVATEYVAKAKYDLDGMLRLMTTMVENKVGNRTTDYLSSHPGWNERIDKAIPAIATQRLESVAARALENKRWNKLGEIVENWLEREPNSARVWYYRGFILRQKNDPSALYAFAKSVQINPTSVDARLEYCVELYRAEQLRDSLVCAEHLPLNDPRDQFVMRTFKNSVHVGGMAPTREVSDEDALILAIVLGRPELVPSSLRRSPKDVAKERAKQVRNARAEVYIAVLRQRCEDAKKRPQGSFRDAVIKADCGAYDDAVRRQYDQIAGGLSSN